MKTQEEVQAYLAKIRKTVEQSEQLLEAVRLRRAETDRLLAQQGVTREQLAAMRFTPEQKDLVNRELARRGYEQIADWDDMDGALAAEQRAAAQATLADADATGDVESRRRKFGVFMQTMRL